MDATLRNLEYFRLKMLEYLRQYQKHRDTDPRMAAYYEDLYAEASEEYRRLRDSRNRF